MYTFQYQITDKDYLEYNLYHHYTMPFFRRRLMMQKFFIPWLFMTVIFCIGTAYHYPLIVYAILAAFPVGWIVFFKKRLTRTMQRDIKTMEASGKLPFINEYTAVFGEDRIKTVTCDSEMYLCYPAVEKIVIGKNAFYLYTSVLQAAILPHRIFASEEEKESFLQFVKEKTKAAVIAGVTK